MAPGLLGCPSDSSRAPRGIVLQLSVAIGKERSRIYRRRIKHLSLFSCEGRWANDMGRDDALLEQRNCAQLKRTER